jgi:hypothetical protein
VVGQQSQRSKFEKYLRPGTVTTMDIGLLKANIETVRDLASPGGFPRISYDASCPCFSATAFISGELMKKPLNEIRSDLMILAGLARVDLRVEFPEMSELTAASQLDRDFKMTFWQYNFDKPGNKETVAEYSDGKITFK